METSGTRRRDYKRQLDEAQVRAGMAEAELEMMTSERDEAHGIIGDLRREVEALKQQLVAAEQRVERARIIGAMGLASSLLVPVEDVEGDLRA